MEQYFSLNYTGAPFELFNTPHLIALGVILLINLSFFYFRNIWGDVAKRRVRYTIAAILILAEIGWHGWSLYHGVWTIQQTLPLHLCSVLIWASVVMMFNKSYTIYELAYFLGLGGATQALLTPDAGIYGFPHFRAFQTFTDHGALITAVMYMTVIEGYRPTLQSFKRMFLWANIYMAFVFVLNLLIGSNYMFIAHKPEFPTLIDLLLPWPWYILQLELIAFLIAGLLYLPFLLKDWLAAKKAVALA